MAHGTEGERLTGIPIGHPKTDAWHPPRLMDEHVTPFPVRVVGYQETLWAGWGRLEVWVEGFDYLSGLW
jgi:hypothetical protein